MKKLFEKPCFYYPTAAILLDDSESSLTKLSLTLDDNLIYTCFSDPIKALDYITKNNTASQMLRSTLIENTEQDTYGLKANEHHTKINLASLYKEMYNSQRYMRPSVLVVDYMMPHMNGVEVCQQLAGCDIQIVMLTGKGDETFAVDLLNRRIINKFILKSEPHFGRAVNDAILELQQAYFATLSHTLFENLMTQSYFCLQDPVFNQIFDTLCQQNKIVEYYIFTAAGNFILLAEDGNLYWLIVVDEKMLHDYIEVAEDQGASPTIIKALKMGHKIPYFPTHKDYMNAGDHQWKNYLYPAKKVVGQHTYYYAWVTTPLFDLKYENIKNLNDYLNNNWPPS